jgi:glycerol-3-phosphate dehydrogenase
MTDNELANKAVEQAKLALESGKSRQAYIEAMRGVINYEELTPEQEELIDLAWESEEEGRALVDKIQFLFENNYMEKLRDLFTNRIKFYFEHYDNYLNMIGKLVEFFVENHKSLEENPYFSEVYQKYEKILSEYLITQKERLPKNG